MLISKLQNAVASVRLPKARDASRLGAQSAAAAGATYLLLSVLDWPHLSWALISALFVLQQNSDATRHAAAGRLAGAAFGAAVGLATVFLWPGDGATLARLASAAFVANAVSIFKPGWRYAVVAAVAVALDPGGDALWGAFERIRAIAAGTAIGLLSAFFVFPERASKRARRALRRALGECAALADASLSGAVGAGSEELKPLHDRYLTEIRKARARVEDCRTTERRQLDRALHGVERLWHDLILLDRLCGRDGEMDASPQLRSAVCDVRQALCAEIELARARLGGGEGASDTRPLAEALERARPAVQRSQRHNPVEANVLLFALDEMQADLQRLGRQVGPGERAGDGVRRAAA